MHKNQTWMWHRFRIIRRALKIAMMNMLRAVMGQVGNMQEKMGNIRGKTEI